MNKSKYSDIAKIVVITFAVLFFRRYDAFTYPQFWAEDGTVFFMQYDAHGLASITLPYAGYLLLLPRLFSVFVGLIGVPLVDVPSWYNALAFLTTLAVVLYQYKCAEWLGIRNRMLYSVVCLLLPLGSEIFMNITNIMWFTSLFLIQFLFVGYRRFEESRYKWVTYVMLFVTSLTGPFAVLLSPLVLIIIFLERKTIFKMARLMPLLIILGSGLLQVAVISSSGGGARVIPGTSEKYHVLRLIEYIMNDFTLLSKGLFPDMPEVLQNSINLTAFCVLAYLIYLCYNRLKAERKYVLIVSAAFYFASYIAAYWPMETAAIPFGCPRYYFVPFACLASVIIVAADAAITVSGVVVYSFYFLMHSRTIVSVLPDKKWRKQVRDYISFRTDSIGINPEGWMVTPRRTK